MSCCGGKRRQLPTSPSHSQASRRHRARSYALPQTTSAALFEYIGRTALTVRGPISGWLYRFSHPGARLSIDGRDAPGMAAVANLRRVRQEQRV